MIERPASSRDADVMSERERERDGERESVIVCGRVLRTDCISECVHRMCVYASFNSSLTRTVCACVFDMMSPCCDPEQGKDAVNELRLWSYPVSSVDAVFHTTHTHADPYLNSSSLGDINKH